MDTNIGVTKETGSLGRTFYLVRHLPTGRSLVGYGFTRKKFALVVAEVFGVIVEGCPWFKESTLEGVLHQNGKARVVGKLKGRVGAWAERGMTAGEIIERLKEEGCEL